MIEKYLTRKKKNMLEYAKTLEELITLENNTLWKTKQEFVNLAKDVIDIYVEDYYFDNNIHRDNPVEYSNDNINYVLKSMIEYCKRAKVTYFLQEKKNETFLLSVIITTCCYVDISANVADGDFAATKRKFRYLLEYLQKTNILKVYINNTRIIKELFDKLKENNTKEEKFFEAFVNPNFYNTYRLYTKNPGYYLVDYRYSLEGLDEENPTLVNGIKEKFREKFVKSSNELLEIHLIKELLTNNDVRKYLVEAPKKESLLEPFNDMRIKENILLLFSFQDYKKNEEYIINLKNKGYKVIYEIEKSEELEFISSVRDINLIVDKDMLAKYEDKLPTWKKQGIEFILKNKEEEK